MHVEQKSKFNISKGLIGILIAIPLCIEVGFLSFLALSMGIMSLPFGLVFLLLGALGCLYVYSLIASLWLDRRDGWIVFGLLEGMLFLGIGAYNVFDDAIGRFSSVNSWTTKSYFETFVLGPLAIAGIALSVYLLYKRMPPSHATRLLGAPTLVRHAAVPSGDSPAATERPMRPPDLPYRDPKLSNKKPLQAEQPGPDQPATRPADKPPVKDQPSTPTPKDGPR